MRKLLTLTAALLACVAGAQHCPFDYAGIIVLQIHAPNQDKIIPGLKVYITDSSSRPVMHDYYRNGAWENDTLWFWQNPPVTTFTGYIDNENPAETEKIRFPFAKDNYVCVVPRNFSLGRYRIVVRDGDGTQNGYFPEVRRLWLADAEVFSLCGTYDDEVYKSRNGDLVYRPTEVILRER